MQHKCLSQVLNTVLKMVQFASECTTDKTCNSQERKLVYFSSFKLCHCPSACEQKKSARRTQ